METHDPLTLSAAQAFWESVAHTLHARTVYQVVRMAWLSEEARCGIIQDGAIIDNIIDCLRQQFFGAAERGKIWCDAAERWLSRTHRRTTRKMAAREARNYFRTFPPGQDGSTGHFEIPANLDSPECAAEKREILARIAHHWSNLPPAKASLFLDLVEGLLAEDISARDGIRSGTVRKRIYDLRQELRNLVATDAGRERCPREPRQSKGAQTAKRSKQGRKAAA